MEEDLAVGSLERPSKNLCQNLARPRLMASSSVIFLN